MSPITTKDGSAFSTGKRNCTSSTKVCSDASSFCQPAAPRRPSAAALRGGEMR
jgi:hypothetical protein